MVSGLYLLTGPSVGVARNLFRAFVAARYVHTIVYLNEVGNSYLKKKEWWKHTSFPNFSLSLLFFPF